MVELKTLDVITTVKNYRDREMLRTAFSLFSQKISFRWRIVDASVDTRLKDFLLEHGYGDFVYMHHPHVSIYTGMNLGLRAADSELTFVLNEGDVLFDGALENLTNALKKHQSDVVVGSMFQNGNIRSPSPINSGIHLHHLYIHHNAALIKKSAYETVGYYNPDFKIAAEAEWFGRAYSHGIELLSLDTPIVDFEPGGVSDAKTDDQKKIVVDDQVSVYRRIFPEVSQRVLRSIYWYRFKEEAISESLLLELQKSCESDEIFRDSVLKAFKFIWNNIRPTKELRKDAFIRRCKISSAINPSRVPLFEVFDVKLDGDIEIDAHFVKRFSRPSETFIASTIKSLALARPSISPVVICEERTHLSNSRFEGIIICSDELTFDFSELHENQVTDLIPLKFIASAHFHFLVIALHFKSWLMSLSDVVGTVCYSHGIDVRQLETTPRLREEMLEILENRPRCCVTSPSVFLDEKLQRLGISSESRFIVGNPVQPWKSKINQSEVSDVQILHVARPIAWKGHDTLFQALAILKEKGIYATATCILADSLESKDSKNVIAIANSLNLENQISFVEFFDFSDESKVLSANLFVSSSLSEEAYGRTETFGMSNVEAKIEGLTLVISDSGAQREILSNPLFKDDSRAVFYYTPGNALELAKLIEDHSEKLQTGNEKLLRHGIANPFNIEDFGKGINQIVQAQNLKKKLVTFSTSYRGGAGKSSAEIIQILQRHPLIDCLSITLDDPSAEISEAGKQVVARNASSSDHLSRFDDGTILSHTNGGLAGSDLLNWVKGSNLNVVNWTRGLLSNEAIAMLSWLDTPLLIVLRDYQHITGGCHYAQGCKKFETGCVACPQVARAHEQTIVESNYDFKLRNWNIENIHWVALSEQSKQFALRSPLVAEHNIHVLPNPMTSGVVSSEKEIRKESQSTRVLRVAYIPSYAGYSKGTDTAAAIIEEFNVLANKVGIEVEFILNDVSVPLSKSTGVNFKHIGSESIERVLSRCDVTLITSREETFSRTVAESLLVGTPVVSREVGVSFSLSGKESLLSTYDDEALPFDVAKILLETAQKKFDTSHRPQLLMELLPANEQVEKYFLNMTSRKSGRLLMSPHSTVAVRKWFEDSQSKDNGRNLYKPANSAKPDLTMSIFVRLRSIRPSLIRQATRVLLRSPREFFNKTRLFMLGR